MAAVARGDADALGVNTGKWDTKTESYPDSRLLGDDGRIGADQVEDYARRKGMTRAEAERWLGPNLGYTPSAAPAREAVRS